MIDVLVVRPELQMVIETVSYRLHEHRHFKHRVVPLFAFYTSRLFDPSTNENAGV